MPTVLITVCERQTKSAFGNSIQVSTCPSATAYEEVNKTTVADASMAVGDTVVTVTSSTGISAGDIVNFVTSMNIELLVLQLMT